MTGNAFFLWLDEIRKKGNLAGSPLRGGTSKSAPVTVVRLANQLGYLSAIGHLLERLQFPRGYDGDQHWGISLSVASKCGATDAGLPKRRL